MFISVRLSVTLARPLTRLTHFARDTLANLAIVTVDFRATEPITEIDFRFVATQLGS